MSKSMMVGGVLVASILMLCNGAMAGLLIDGFADSPPTSVVQTGPGTTSTSVLGLFILGGVRDVMVDVTSGALDLSINVNAGGTGQYAHSQDSGVSGSSHVQWDGTVGYTATPSMGLSADLTQGGLDNALSVLVVGDDLACTLVFRVYKDASNYSTYSLSLPGGWAPPIDPPRTFTLPYADFTATGTGADFTNAKAITMDIAGRPGLDVTVSLPYTTSVPVPEPATLALLALGGLPLLRKAIRRRK